MNHYKITLIGAGNVATHLGKAIKKAGHEVVQVYSHALSNAEVLAGQINALPTDNLNRIETTADVYIIVAKDDLIHEIFNQIKMERKVIAHTSGMTAIEGVGVFYPLQTFSKNRQLDFSKVPVFIESNQPELLKLAESITTKVFEVTMHQRQALHLAAVFVNNFSNHMLATANNILGKEDLSFDYLKPLLEETIHKIEEMSPKQAQTGPAIRGDQKTIEQHLAVIKEKYPDFLDIYSAITNSIQQ